MVLTQPCLRTVAASLYLEKEPKDLQMTHDEKRKCFVGPSVVRLIDTLSELSQVQPESPFPSGRLIVVHNLVYKLFKFPVLFPERSLTHRLLPSERTAPHNPQPSQLDGKTKRKKLSQEFVDESLTHPEIHHSCPIPGHIRKGNFCLGCGNLINR